MSDTCIVCLGDLGSAHAAVSVAEGEAFTAEDTVKSEAPCAVETTESDDSPAAATAQAAPLGEITFKEDTHVDNKAIRSDEVIAHLLPCGHNIHDECLRPWVERANSCPICRQSFNTIELIHHVGGPVVSSYHVNDRLQVAEVDVSLVTDALEDEEPPDRPCPVCRDDDNEDVLLACDGCDAYYHTYCIGLDRVPAGHWFCETCDPASRVVTHHPSDRRTRGQQRRLRNRNQASSSNWARVWQSVWDNLNLDLDFPFDDTHSPRPNNTRHAQRRDFRQWQRRLQVAERQGAAARGFRDTAPALLDLDPLPESQEEILAWNAFEKAKEIDADPSTKRKRKPSPVAEASAPCDRPLKRPRTRRGADTAAGRRSSPPAGPSFLRSMLREIETANEIKPCLPPLQLASPQNTSPKSLQNTSPSPRISPVSSHHASPSLSPRPSSPLALTSKIEPVFPPLEFSPTNSPAEARPNSRDGTSPTKRPNAASKPRRASLPSMSRNSMPFSTKADLQRMVAAALKPHYQSNRVSKDQYTDINRNVSRLLYDRVGTAGYIMGEEKESIERFAVDEVVKAVDQLAPEVR